CRFGYRLKLLGNTLAVGHDIINLGGGISGGGRVHIFEIENNYWQQQTILRPNDNSRFFCHAVSLSHNLLVVGAFHENHVYIFSRHQDTWNLE
ncbi:MAG: hypothetical protein F6K10_21290, partial [Moorea sp. SIO2B7]|nr:hypothetical protein [Moorena sp. SIO2B7]